jgi:hypothetical protein
MFPRIVDIHRFYCILESIDDRKITKKNVDSRRKISTVSMK